MEELQQLQSTRLKLLLVEQNITQKDLAEKIEVSPTSVNHWVNGKVHMNDDSARLISSEYPEYSPEYLRGYSEYRNSETEKKMQGVNVAGRNYRKIDCVMMLATLPNGADMQSLSLGDAPGRITLEHDGKSITPTFWDWNEFANEVCDYIEMRINRKIERGRW